MSSHFKVEHVPRSTIVVDSKQQQDDVSSNRLLASHTNTHAAERIVDAAVDKSLVPPQMTSLLCFV